MREINTQVAPDLKLRFPGRRESSLSSYSGNVLLLQIISTRCENCIKMVSLLNSLLEQFKAGGFQVLGVAVNSDALGTLPVFVATSGAQFPFCFCPADEVRRFLDLPKDKPFHIPVIVFLDRRGRVCQTLRPETYFFENAETTFPQLIGTLLQQPRPGIAPLQEEQVPTPSDSSMAAQPWQQELLETINRRNGTQVDLALHLADRTQLQLRALRKKVVLLVLIGVDCTVCIALVKDLNRLAEELGSFDAEIVGIVADPNHKHSLQPFVDRTEVRFRVGYVPLKAVHACLQIPMDTWLHHPSFVFLDRLGCKRALLNGLAGSENGLLGTLHAAMEALLEEEPL